MLRLTPRTSEGNIILVRESTPTLGVTMYTKSKVAAQFIRKQLKADYPGVKFSVRTDTGVWYDSIRISYSDEHVNVHNVRNDLNKFCGYRFNGMTDNHDPQPPVVIDGQEYSFPISFINVNNQAL